MVWKNKRTNPDRAREVDAYLENTHQFQLMRGQGEGATKFGAPQTMTGLEAVEHNRAYEEKFRRDKSPTARMWRLTPLNPIDGQVFKSRNPDRKYRSMSAITSDG